MLIVCLTSSQTLWAQSTNSQRERKWELELHGSGFIKSDAKGGVKALPGQGTSFATATPGVESRAVSSFLFGDGNALVNQVLMGQGLNPIGSLDITMLNNRFALERQGNIGVGFRISRYVSDRFWLDWANEYDFDYDHGSFEINEREEADGFQSMKTWVTSLESLFANCGAPCGNHAVAARELTTHEKGHQVSSALTVNYDLIPGAKLTPYVGAGAGLVISYAGTPRQEYFGHFFLLNGAIQESDHVQINFQVPPVVPAFIVTAGLKYDWTPRWGVRLEARSNFESHSFKTLVRALPEFTDGGVGNTIVLSSGGTGLQFRDNQSLARSSLSNPLPQFRTFKSTGMRYEGRISGGVYCRF